MPKPPTNVHDSFFKGFMAEPALAGTFLREHLPTAITELHAPGPPEPVPGSFVDERLAQHHSDMLFRVGLKTGEEMLAYVLIEHKSSPDELARLQLLRYIVRILVRWHKEHKRIPLPVVIPLLAHQGPEGWEISTEFADLFGAVPAPLRPYVISFRHALVDLAGIPDEALSVNTRLRAFLKIMKYIQRPDLPQHLSVILVPELADVDLETFIDYIDKGPVPVSPEMVRQALWGLDERRRENIMGHLSQQFFAQGEAQGIAVGEARGEARGLALGEARGRAQGKAIGLAQGEAKALIRLLEKRFGAVPKSVRKRIFDAEVASVESWIDRVLEAAELGEVFE